MKFVAVSCFIALIASSSGLPTGPENNSIVKNALEPRIIDGSLPTKTLYYEVAILSDEQPVKLCTGAFISTKWILTSAYCAKRRPTLRVYYGESTVSLGISTESQLVERTYCHPSYNPLTSDHDVALLELATPVTNQFVTVVQLPSTTHYSYLGLTATVSGWGPLPGSSSIISDCYLQSKETIVINNAYCTREGIRMSTYKLCTEDRAICEGDQGAPLVINNRVIGIATAAYNANKCEGAIVTPYTRISYYLSWIQRITQIPCSSC